ncbi:histamine H2 receptor-like [Tubulanus polymorphus]|uniref:histamine H2 receptor-like n=1 Tax=Tubulanus polymorphus TaxID=672921 RepID=UPI003DA29A73
MANRHQTPSDEYYVAQGVLLMVIVFFATFGNSLACIVVYKTGSVNTATGLFILSLAIADLMRGILVMPFTLVASFRLGHLLPDTSLCNLFGFTNTLFLSAGLLTLSAVSIDRYLAITQPLQYYQTMTSRKAVAMIVVVWVIALIDATIPLLNQQGYVFTAVRSICSIEWAASEAYSFTSFVVCFVVPFFILTFCYIRIFHVAWQQQRKIHALTRTWDVHVPDDKSRHRGFGHYISYRLEKRSSFTIFIVFGVFCICITPYQVINIWSVYTSSTERDIMISNALSASCLISFANSACNPFLYGIMNKKFRRTFLNLLFCKPKNFGMVSDYEKNGRSRASFQVAHFSRDQSSLSAKSDEKKPRIQLLRPGLVDKFTCTTPPPRSAAAATAVTPSSCRVSRNIKTAVVGPLKIISVIPEDWNMERRFSRIDKSASDTNLRIMK